MINKKSKIPLGDKNLLFPKEKLGKGAFGEVYLGLDKQTNNYVAIKIENTKNNNQLIQETLILKYLQGCIGIPQYHSFIKNNNYNFLILDLLGPNLESLFEKMNNHFSIKTIIYLGIEMINIIENIHKRHIIHRDIKPENFVISLNKNTTNNSIYLIDFGLSKRFRDPKTGEHIPYKDNKLLTGTARFSSIYTHLGIEQSRRDDLEGIIYTLIYFYKGNLPWQNINNCNEKILEKKINISIDSLCEGMPIEFNDLLSYVRSLQFDEKPDYEMMRKKLVDLLNKEKLSINNINFDWIEKNLSNDNLSTLDDDI
jgi:serine/threonine protein kinase